MIKINSQPIKIGKFPNGETAIDKPTIDTLCPTYGEADVTFLYEGDEDLIHLMMVKDYLDTKRLRWINLKIPYMCYSRMDRDMLDHLFTLKSVSKFINKLGFNEIDIYEPHSDVTSALLDNVAVNPTTMQLVIECMIDIVFDYEKDFLLFPDAGAQKHYSSLFPDCKQLLGVKERDLRTGSIKELKVYSDDDLKGSRVIIVDDLCSKGGTFIGSASILKERNAGEIYLAVGHCEKTILEGGIPTSDMIDGVYTTNSIIQDNEGIDKIKIAYYF